MKKSVLVVALTLGVSSVFAQSQTRTIVTDQPQTTGTENLNTQGLVSKKGEPYLPETDDWAIGIDAIPFLRYAGNLFNGTNGNTSPSNNFPNGFAAITGKMFKDEKTAYRAKLRIGFGSQKRDTVVPSIPPASSGPPTFVKDERKFSYSNITLGAGMEWRRGKTRLQGFYGAEALLMFGGSKTVYSYGNPLSAQNPALRLKESKNGTTIGITLRGFIGAEYFIFPKIAVGGEFGWGLGFSSTGEGKATRESWGGAAIIEENRPIGKSSNFGIDTDNSGGALTVTFHF